LGEDSCTVCHVFCRWRSSQWSSVLWYLCA